MPRVTATTPRLYPYVGPAEIAARRATTGGTPVRSAADVFRWIRAERQELDDQRRVIATFVIDEEGVLRIADRHSEHCACAGGRPVRSAGEITFHVADNGVEAVWVTNQSTGYCPEPESWEAVARALDSAGIGHPGRFGLTITFRRCPRCGQINIVKDEVFACDACRAPLPADWNCADGRRVRE